ncbi:MAG: replication-associated recombination protein A [Bacteriovoracaceae bacterium]|nr:replication-associated recombination protein A [Bacteriovoracaceae bacterium]
MKDVGPDLFSSPNSKDQALTNGPLAHRVRPTDFSGFFGQEAIFKKHPFLKGEELPSLILWGPPGSGKTTLAQILCHHRGLELYLFNAVLGGVADLKKVIERAKEIQQFYDKKAVIFVDEIHRFNKAQQDALLPYVEKGEFIFIGATTENPKTSVNRALLSRVHLVTLAKLSPEALENILNEAMDKIGKKLAPEIIEVLSKLADGDARQALNTLEALVLREGPVTIEDVKESIGGAVRNYDKNQDRHYDVISAFIKSMRGSDPDAALLYLAIMLDGGEDPKFIARRLVIFASEDVGNADPQALTLAISGLSAVENIGMPEARINLAQVTTYLASTVKSNACYKALDEALEYVRTRQTVEVPTHLRNTHPDKYNYQYPHSYPGAFVEQQYSPLETPSFYRPTGNGTEAKILDRLKKLWPKRF